MTSACPVDRLPLVLVPRPADLSDGSGWLTSLLNVDALINSPALSVYVLIMTSECTVDISWHTAYGCCLRDAHLPVHCHRASPVNVGNGRVCNIAPRAATGCSPVDHAVSYWSTLHQSKLVMNECVMLCHLALYEPQLPV